jgi:hypothetical protein
MFGWFRPTCPVGPSEKAWIEDRFRWLSLEFGLESLRSAPVVLPTPAFFPDAYGANRGDAAVMFRSVCGYMAVDPDAIQLEFFKGTKPTWDGVHHGAAGTHEGDGWRTTIRIDEGNFDDPTILVATMAHELGHVRLLDEGRIPRTTPDHEPLTDLLTVFLGLGVLTANSRFRFKTERDGFKEGWSVRRLGYLDERAIGYALALFAWVRGERRPPWLRHLRLNPRTFCKQGLQYLHKTGDSSFDPVRPTAERAAQDHDAGG